MNTLSDKDKNALDKLWDKFTGEDKVEEDKEGRFITLENDVIKREGLHVPEFKDPGKFEAFQEDTGMEHTYFGRPASQGKTKIFKRSMKTG